MDFKIVAWIILYVLGVILYLILYLRALERMNYDPQTFSERWVLGPVLAGKPLWMTFLLWAVCAVIVFAPLYFQRHPFWENDTAQSCTASNGTWHETGSSKYTLVKCAVFFDTSRYENTVLDIGGYYADSTPVDTIGYCKCAEHSCWDEAQEICVPGEVYPE